MKKMAADLRAVVAALYPSAIAELPPQKQTHQEQQQQLRQRLLNSESCQMTVDPATEANNIPCSEKLCDPSTLCNRSSSSLIAIELNDGLRSSKLCSRLTEIAAPLPRSLPRPVSFPPLWAMSSCQPICSTNTDDSGFNDASGCCDDVFKGRHRELGFQVCQKFPEAAVKSTYFGPKFSRSSSFPSHRRAQLSVRRASYVGHKSYITGFLLPEVWTRWKSLSFRCTALGKAAVADFMSGHDNCESICDEDSRSYLESAAPPLSLAKWDQIRAVWRRAEASVLSPLQMFLLTNRLMCGLVWLLWLI